MQQKPTESEIFLEIFTNFIQNPRKVQENPTGFVGFPEIFLDSLENPNEYERRREHTTNSKKI